MKDYAKINERRINMLSLFKKLFTKDNLREKGIRYVRKNFGEQFVDEFKQKYDDINSGIPIGGLQETIVFIDLVETIKKWDERNA